MYVKEITPPEGYTVDPTEYEVTLTYEGQEVAEVTRDLTVQEQVKKQAFQLIKISEDGNQTETDLVEGAGFKVYLVSSLSKVRVGNYSRPMGISLQRKISVGMISVKRGGSDLCGWQGCPGTGTDYR